MHIFSNTDVNKDLNPLKLFALEIENTGAWRVRNPAADRPRRIGLLLCAPSMAINDRELVAQA